MRAASGLYGDLKGGMKAPFLYEGWHGGTLLGRVREPEVEGRAGKRVGVLSLVGHCKHGVRRGEGVRGWQGTVQEGGHRRVQEGTGGQDEWATTTHVR